MLCISACGNLPPMDDFSTFQAMNADRWDRECIIELGSDSLPAKPGYYDVEIVARLTPDFKYRTLWLAADFDSLAPDTVEITIATPDGTRLGSGLKNLREVSTPLFRHVYIKAPWTIAISTAMPESPIKGVNDIGVTLRRSENQNSNR